MIVVETVFLILFPFCLQRLGENKEERVENLSEMINGYFEQKAHHLNVNVLDRTKLVEAMENPDKYPNLTIRISGYAVNFHKLTREQQLNTRSSVS